MRKPSNVRAGINSGMRFIPLQIADLPVMLMRELYDRGSGLPIRKGDLSVSQLEAYQKKVDIDEKHLLRMRVWPSSEIVVNKCLEAVLMAAPPKAVARAINTLAPEAGLASPSVCELVRPKSLMGLTGRPDFVLFDKVNESLVFGELKIGAKRTNERYKFEQLKKYMQLGVLARTHLNLKHVTHLIVLPSKKIEEHCDKPHYWKPEIAAGRRLASRVPRQFLTMFAVYKDAAIKMAKALPVDVQGIVSAIDRENPLIPIPTYVVTWDELSSELTRTCSSEGAGHLAGSCELLKTLGTGDA